jgi:hypothetical protein
MWYDEVAGASCHGALRFRNLLVGKTIVGKWIGFSTDRTIKSGDWEWKRPHIDKYPSYVSIHH